MKHIYKPKGVCAHEFVFEVEGNTIVGVEIKGGCAGNLLGISKMITGKSIDEVVGVFENVKCGLKPTSCPDQIAKALIEIQAQ